MITNPVPVVAMRQQVRRVEFARVMGPQGGEYAELVEFDGDHMAHVEPGSTAWQVVIGSLRRFLDA